MQRAVTPDAIFTRYGCALRLRAVRVRGFQPPGLNSTAGASDALHGQSSLRTKRTAADMRATITFLLVLVASAIARPTSSGSFDGEGRSDALPTTSVAAASDGAAGARGAGEEKDPEADLAALRSAEEGAEAMAGAETVAFRPLFVHRDRLARYGSKARVRRQAPRRQPPRQRTPPIRPFRKGRKPLQILY